MRLAILALPLATLACAAPTPEQRAARAAKAAENLAELTEGRVAGPAERCVSVTQLRNPRILDGVGIVWDGIGRRELWVSRPENACNSLRSGNTLVTTIRGASICRGEPFEILEPGARIPVGFCSYGEFVPYRRAAQ